MLYIEILKLLVIISAELIFCNATQLGRIW